MKAHILLPRQANVRILAFFDSRGSDSVPQRKIGVFWHEMVKFGSGASQRERARYSTLSMRPFISPRPIPDFPIPILEVLERPASA
jgi:hypothetical protein